MQKLDDLIQGIITETLESRSALLECLRSNKMNVEQSVEQITHLTDASRTLAYDLTSSNPSDRKALYQQIVQRVTIHSDRIEIVLKP